MENTFTYELPFITDDEIQKEIDAVCLTDTITPEFVRKYILSNIYDLFCKYIVENKEVIFKNEVTK